MNRLNANYSNLGFTLMELLIVMLIVGILAAIGLPSFKYVTNANRIATEINGLVGDLQYARSQAVKQGLPVTVCASANATSCLTGNTWGSGWIVFQDSNGNKVLDAPQESVIRIQRAFAGDTFTADAANFNAVTFNREGFASTGVVTDVTLALRSATPNSAWTRCIAISPVGMLTPEKVGAGNCT